MSRMQKFAWFNLSVIGLSLLVVLGLVPVLGWFRAQGGLGLSGLLGFGVLFFRRKPNEIITDERDELIRGRSATLSFALFWVLYVAVASGASVLIYGQDGSIPVFVVQMSVFWALMFHQAVMSIAILAQYRGVSEHAE